MTEQQRDRMRAWVAALRSGRYRQGQLALRRNDSYCCLGVACDLYSRETGVAWEAMKLDADDCMVIYRFLGTHAFLPDEVLAWLGLTWRDEWMRPGGIHMGARHDAINMNDQGASFAEIADEIEARYCLQDSPPLEPPASQHTVTIEHVMEEV